MKINDLKNNLSSFSRPWQFVMLFFLLSIISVFASFLMDQKLYIKQKNKNELEILKASFSIHTFMGPKFPVSKSHGQESIESGFVKCSSLLNFWARSC